MQYPRRHSMSPTRGRLHLGEPRWVRFARQPIVDGSTEPMGHELGYCEPESTDEEASLALRCRTSSALNHGLLEGGLRHRLPGQLFVAVDAAVLMSPVAETISPAVGVVQLVEPLAPEESLTRRIAQLHARGHRFALAGVSDGEDPRWAWAPFSSFLKMDVSAASSAAWPDLISRAKVAGLRVVAERLSQPADYLRLRRLGVQFFQGDLVAPRRIEFARALPACDPYVLDRLAKLAEHGASRDTLAMVAATDPALVIRLLMLQRLYGPERTEPARPGRGGTLLDVLNGLPYDILAGWCQVLLRSAVEAQDNDRDWSVAVREQMYNFRSRLIGARACRSPAELEARVFELYRRICSRELLVAVPPGHPRVD